MKYLKIASLVLVVSLVFSCKNSTDVVESGTYEGTVKKVEAEKNEIYVQTNDNKTLELYFTDETQLTKQGEEVDFSALQEDLKVKVEVEKVGKRLDPISVEILE